MTPEKMVRDDWDEVLEIRPLEDLAKKALGYDVPFLHKWISHMDYDEMWKRGNWKERFGKRRVPALIKFCRCANSGYVKTTSAGSRKAYN